MYIFNLLVRVVVSQTFGQGFALLVMFLTMVIILCVVKYMHVHIQYIHMDEWFCFIPTCTGKSE